MVGADWSGLVCGAEKNVKGAFCPTVESPRSHSSLGELGCLGAPSGFLGVPPALCSLKCPLRVRPQSDLEVDRPQLKLKP